MYTVTADVSANYRKLKVMQLKGLISIFSIRIENNQNRQSAILPTATVNYAALDLARVGSSEQAETFNKLKKIIGKNNIEDCLHLEAHIRDEHDYFVTEDHDILDRIDKLYREFPKLKIRTVNELIRELKG
jgi:hypothetical protein